MIIEIKALDTLFFRDGKSFNMGEDTWANGIFPPSPSVFYGALRTAYLSNNTKYISIAGTEQDPTRKLNIKGIYYNILNKGIHFKMPLDMVIDKHKKRNVKAYMLKNIKKEDLNYKFITSNKNISNIFVSDEEVENGNGFIDKIDFIKYLNCSNCTDFTYQNVSEYIIDETKIGIKRNKITGTTDSDDNKLFRLNYCRLKNISFLVEFDGIDYEPFEKGIIKLGGEGKCAVYYNRKENEEVNIDVEFDSYDEVDKNFFKLYLLTPTFFEKGWIPKWIDEENLEGIVPRTQCKVKLINAAIGNPIYIGGYDIKANIPKPLKKAVPAGSVYYFEIINGSLENIVKALNKTSICEYGMGKEGYGIVFVGGIK